MESKDLGKEIEETFEQEQISKIPLVLLDLQYFKISDTSNEDFEELFENLNNPIIWVPFEKSIRWTHVSLENHLFHIFRLKDFLTPIKFLQGNTYV